MTSLPIASSTNSRRPQRISVHCVRVLLFLSILWLIRFAHRQTEFLDSNLSSNEQAIEFVRAAFPGAVNIGPFNSSLDGNFVTDESGNQLGCVRQTSPVSDQIIGYSGPTNCLIAIDLEKKIQSVAILSSRDTVDHVAIVKQHQPFLQSFAGLGFETSDQWSHIDAVSGATLTSYSIISSVANRMSGTAPSLKFTTKPTLKKVTVLFPSATTIKATDRASVWDAFNTQNEKLGFILSTTPEADRLSGYQGPTATLAGFDNQGKCLGLVVDQTYDNDPYATYLNRDVPFQRLYRGKSLEEISKMVPEELGIEGVSGATMTSLCVADGLPLAAAAAVRSGEPSSRRAAITRSTFSYWADGVTIILTIIGVAFSFTKLRHHKWFRSVYQIAAVMILGFTSGHMLSQALVAGWSAHSIPWTVVPGLVFLSMAALIVPIVSKHQPYCQHICPFGALQQLGRHRLIQNRIGWKLHIPASISRALECIPFALLILVVFVGVSRSTFNLASIESFDGFVFRVAGWASIGIFVVGLLFSLVSPMAYCRFGCPTGAMLNYLRFRADSDRLGVRDLAAAGLTVFALILLA